MKLFSGMSGLVAGVSLFLGAAAVCVAQEEEDWLEYFEEDYEEEEQEEAPQKDDSLTLLERFVAEKEQQPILYTVRCKHISAETLRRLIENFLTPVGTVACSEEDDLLSVSDTAERIAQIKGLIAEADKPVPQVLVEARIVEFELNDSLTKEMDLGFASMGDSDSLRKVLSSLIFPTRMETDSNVGRAGAGGGGSMGRLWTFAGSDSFKIWGLLNYLETKNCARLLSSPNIVIRRGADGNIATGEKVPISTETITGNSISTSTRYENVGVKLIVRPIMIAEDRIRLRINPEFSNITRYEASGARAPYIALRSVTTELEAKSGEMIVIGGLLRKEE
ncbi:MAG: type II and III secretion system protein, partial [Kiritimatiellaeota bacterium]|nr:type II and III secretion system protein [Kiritimatiellota bacterium]